MSAPAQSTGSAKLDAVVQTAKAADPTKPSGLALYSRFALAGAVCCSVTHGALTPVDVYVFSLRILLALPALWFWSWAAIEGLGHITCAMLRA